MAGHHLIDGYLARMADRLPADAVDELADGLTETYHRYLSGGLHPDAAAGAAIAEFGAPDVILTAFVRESPGRRTARALICSGPVVGACWAAALVAGRAWAWPVPVALPLAFGLTLLAAIATLAVAATSRHSYHRTRVSAAAGLALVALDAGMLTAVMLVAQSFAWPMALAMPASLTRMVMTMRAMPRLLAR
jgi:hypothetical protein